jgi:hypothetical protein
METLGAILAFLLLYIMAHIGNILRDKLFVFSGSTQTTEVEKEILSQICEKENLGDAHMSVLIDNNEDYDSYKVRTNSGEFLIKLSLDEDLKIFGKEFNILSALKHEAIAPKPIALNQIQYGQKMPYLITSFEQCYSGHELGKSILLSNYEECLSLIKTVHKADFREISFREKICEIFDATDFAKQAEFADLIKASSQNFNFLNDEIASVKEYIEGTYSPLLEGSTLCHGNINASTLLIGMFDIKLINWQNAFNGNPLTDVANLRLEFGFGEQTEYRIFNFYNSLGTNYSWEEYLAVRNFMASLRLLEYVFAYIKEIYLFRSLRQDKILSIFSAFCRNILFFEHIPAFRKNKEDLISLFSAPML